jgi:molybdenum cofactor guanylyltransferase
VAAPGQDIPPLPDDIVIARDPIPDRGPLQGISAGLSALGTMAEAAVVSSTDAPFLEPALIRRLLALRGDRYEIAVPRAQDHDHPLSAVYSIRVRAEIDAMLDAGQLRSSLLFERVSTLFVTAAVLLQDAELAGKDPELWSLRNLNTPEEYAAALRDAGLSPPGA